MGQHTDDNDDGVADWTQSVDVEGMLAPDGATVPTQVPDAGCCGEMDCS